MMDIQLNYIEQGSGFPLILLHGNDEDHTYFVHQIEYFSRQYRVIALDSRGHGASPRGEAPFSLWQFADDLHDFMDEHRIKKAHLLGFSDGGNIGLCFALKYPERIGKLIVDGANLFFDGLKPYVRNPIAEAYERAVRLSEEDANAKREAEMLGLMVNDPNIDPTDLRTLSMPVLVMAGTNDMIEEHHTKLIHDSIPEAELVWIQGDHFIANQSPVEFNRLVESFLAK